MYLQIVLYELKILLGVYIAHRGEPFRLVEEIFLARAVAVSVEHRHQREVSGKLLKPCAVVAVVYPVIKIRLILCGAGQLISGAKRLKLKAALQRARSLLLCITETLQKIDADIVAKRVVELTELGHAAAAVLVGIAEAQRGGVDCHGVVRRRVIVGGGENREDSEPEVHRITREKFRHLIERGDMLDFGHDGRGRRNAEGVARVPVGHDGIEILHELCIMARERRVCQERLHLLVQLVAALAEGGDAAEPVGYNGGGYPFAVDGGGKVVLKTNVAVGADCADKVGIGPCRAARGDGGSGLGFRAFGGSVRRFCGGGFRRRSGFRRR